MNFVFMVHFWYHMRRAVSHPMMFRIAGHVPNKLKINTGECLRLQLDAGFFEAQRLHDYAELDLQRKTSFTGSDLAVSSPL